MSWNKGREILRHIRLRRIPNVQLRTSHLLSIILFYIIVFIIMYNYIRIVKPTYNKISNILNPDLRNKTTSNILNPLRSNKSSTLMEYILKHEIDFKPNCTSEYGIEMIRRWSATRIDVCSPRLNEPQSQGHIFCYKREDFERPRLLCVFENAEMRMMEPFYTSNSSNLSLHTKVTLKKGILRINCNASVFEHIPKSFRETALSSFLQDIPSNIQINCSTWVTHTVFWMNRWDHKNAYHFMEDVVTTFESLVVLGKEPEDVELAIYDGMPADNALFTLWPLLFGKGVRVIRQNPFPNNTCFRQSVSNMFGSRSHLTNNGGYNRDIHCSSSILLGLRQFIMDRYGLERQSKSLETKIKILFISRKQLKTRNITRILNNEPEIENAIRTSYPNVDFRFFQPENFTTFKEQIEQVLDVDILIGVHGAGLTYSLFMRPNSTLIEIFMDDRGHGNRHFHNIASWVGLNYDDVDWMSGVRLTPLIQALERTIGNYSSLLF